MPDYVEQMKQYRWTCKRALNAHGIKSANEMLDEIPRDLGVDRYGEGGAVSALEHEVRTVLGKPDAVFMPSGRWPNRSPCGFTLIDEAYGPARSTRHAI